VDSNDMATVHALLAASDAVLPSTGISAVLEVAAGRLVALDVHPPLDLQMSLGVVRRAGRTLPPAAQRAFAIVRRYFEDAEREMSVSRRPASPSSPTAAGAR
jgi:DNA-binding transcriptional LysR family regulator